MTECYNVFTVRIEVVKMLNRTEYINNYKRDNYKRLTVELPKEFYEDVKEHAQKKSESVNGFIKRAIKETMERDSE